MYMVYPILLTMKFSIITVSIIITVAIIPQDILDFSYKINNHTVFEFFKHDTAAVTVTGNYKETENGLTPRKLSPKHLMLIHLMLMRRTISTIPQGKELIPSLYLAK